MQLTFAAENIATKWEQALFTLLLDERDCRFIKYAAAHDGCPAVHKVIDFIAKEKHKGKKAIDFKWASWYVLCQWDLYAEVCMVMKDEMLPGKSPTLSPQPC